MTRGAPSHGVPGAARAPCVVCGTDADTAYVWIDWGPGSKVICGRPCADRLLDALDAFLKR
jgi:hypothetical protein